MKKPKDKFVKVSPEIHQILKIDAAKKGCSMKDYIAGLASGALRPPKERTEK